MLTLIRKTEVSNSIRFGDYELDTEKFQLRKAGEPIPVEPQVFDLLVFLARNSKRTVTKEEVFAAIWGDRIVSDAALSSQIKAARRAVGDDGERQHTIATVHGRGFRFAAPVEHSVGPRLQRPNRRSPVRGCHLSRQASRPSRSWRSPT